MAKNRRSPLVVELIKGLIFLGFGVVLIVQPWLAAVSWLGWVILVAGALIALAMALRIRNARRMRAHVVAEFADGSAVYEKGLQIGGMLYDFSTFGAQIDGASFDGERLSFLYSYYAKRRGRAMEVVEIAVQPEEADKALEAELLADEKERSEHNMLVDLGRNDIGKISRIGTVEVEKYMSIERYSHVMHIGSTVRGVIREDADALDAVDAILPAGTLSGAPKLRACEIINELEDNKRGIYGGAIGYISFTGNLDTCIAIRLAFSKNGKVFVRSGAGIVADSVPEKEYRECIQKAAAVRQALQKAQEGMEA